MIVQILVQLNRLKDRRSHRRYAIQKSWFYTNFYTYFTPILKNIEAVQISQNSQESTCARGVFQWIFWNFKNPYFYRPPVVAASENIWERQLLEEIR